MTETPLVEFDAVRSSDVRAGDSAATVNLSLYDGHSALLEDRTITIMRRRDGPRLQHLCFAFPQLPT